MKKNRNNGGFSLVEVMICVAILGMVTLPILRSFVAAARMNAEAREKQRLTLLAQSMMEEYRTQPLENLLRKAVDEDGLTVVSTDDVLLFEGVFAEGAEYQITMSPDPYLTGDNPYNTFENPNIVDVDSGKSAVFWDIFSEYDSYAEGIFISRLYSEHSLDTYIADYTLVGAVWEPLEEICLDNFSSVGYSLEDYVTDKAKNNVKRDSVVTLENGEDGKYKITCKLTYEFTGTLQVDYEEASLDGDTVIKTPASCGMEITDSKVEKIQTVEVEEPVVWLFYTPYQDQDTLCIVNQIPAATVQPEIHIASQGDTYSLSPNTISIGTSQPGADLATIVGGNNKVNGGWAAANALIFASGQIGALGDRDSYSIVKKTENTSAFAYGGNVYCLYEIYDIKITVKQGKQTVTFESVKDGR